MTIETHQINVPFTEAMRQFVDQRVRSSLRRHIDRVGRVVVRLADDGSANQVCRLHVELGKDKPVIAVGEHADVYVAIREAAERVGRVVDRTLGRRHSVR